MFLASWASTTGAAAVVANADEGAAVEQPECEWVFGTERHAHDRT
jgi:hypothetical protein